MARERVGGYRFANAFSMSKNDSKWNWVEVPGRHSNHPKNAMHTHTHTERSLYGQGTARTLITMPRIYSFSLVMRLYNISIFLFLPSTIMRDAHEEHSTRNTRVNTTTALEKK